MAPDSIPTLATWSYGFAGTAYAVFLVQVLTGGRGGHRARLLVAAVIASIAWAMLVVASTVWVAPAVFDAIQVVDAIRLATWLWFTTRLLRGDARVQQEAAGARGRRILLYAVVTLLLCVSSSLPTTILPSLAGYTFAAGLGVAVCGLVLLEQLYRRTPGESRWAIKPFCLGLGVGFAFDLALYADAMMFSRMAMDLWAARGFVYALGVPLIAVATARNKAWTVDVAVSRGVITFSTALLASGLYLLVTAGAGYYLRYLGGTWGRAVQASFVAAAVLAFIVFALSGSARARIRVLVSKHFFSYRFDYREEWMRFTRTLSTRRDDLSLYVLCVKALGDIVESPAGWLWARRGEEFVPVGRWNVPAATGSEAVSSEFSAFLARTGWIVDVDECRARPERYNGLTLPQWLAAAGDGWLIVPLLSGIDLSGFVVLCRPRTSIDVDWEVLDILKAAGRQAATYVIQVEATEALLESQKFDAFNRMSAFVVHDLRNLVAQLSLLLKNAERHSNNPEFQRDMVETVRHVVARMGSLMLQLRTGATPIEETRPVELGPLVSRVCTAKTVHGRDLRFESRAGLTVSGHEDRLEHVIGHLVQNALDAIAADGHVSLRLYADGPTAVVEVRDDGIGMTREFMSNDLFRPFRTTKAQGMGIGMYESRQYVEGLGGRVHVDSAPGVGTTVRVALPQLTRDLASSDGLQEAV